MNHKRRVDRLEERSPWGSAAEIAAAPIIVMRVPEACGDDARLASALAHAKKTRQILRPTSSRKAASLPLWRPVLLQRLSDDLLTELISEAEARVSILEQDNPQ